MNKICDSYLPFCQSSAESAVRLSWHRRRRGRRTEGRATTVNFILFSLGKKLKTIKGSMFALHALYCHGVVLCLKLTGEGVEKDTHARKEAHIHMWIGRQTDKQIKKIQTDTESKNTTVNIISINSRISNEKNNSETSLRLYAAAVRERTGAPRRVLAAQREKDLRRNSTASSSPVQWHSPPPGSWALPRGPLMEPRGHLGSVSKGRSKGRRGERGGGRGGSR